MQGATCDYSVIIPAYNEEDYLGLTLESLGKARKATPHLIGECIVVDNQCTDRTVEIAKKFGCRVVLEPVHKIAKVRNTGAAASTGKYLIFVDADTIVPVETFQKALKALHEENIGCGGARLSFDHNYGRWFSGVFLPTMWNIISQKLRLFAGEFYLLQKRSVFLQEDFLRPTLRVKRLFYPGN